MAQIELKTIRRINKDRNTIHARVQTTYSSSKVSADGQVVDIMFSDGIKFEVVPAFRYSDGSGFCYPDTNNGGSWRNMNPSMEIGAFNYINNETKNAEWPEHGKKTRRF